MLKKLTEPALAGMVFPVERMMRDARITETYEETSKVQRTVIGLAMTRD